MFYLLYLHSLLVKDDEARNVILVLLFDDWVEPFGSPHLINAFQLEFPADGAAKSRTKGRIQAYSLNATAALT